MAGRADADAGAVVGLPQKPRTGLETKLDSQILYALRRHRGDLGRDIPQEIDLAIRGDGRVLVDIDVREVKPAEQLITQHRGQIIRGVPEGKTVRAWMQLDRMEALAESELVRFIRRAAGAETRR